MLRRLHRGDPAGVEALIERYTPYVAAIAARMIPGCPQEWEELTADVFLCAWRERKKLQPGKVKSWLAAVARNRALNRLRERRELLPLEEDILVLAQEALSGSWRPRRRPSWCGRRWRPWSHRTGSCLSATTTMSDRGKGGGGDGNELLYRQDPAAPGPGKAETAAGMGGIYL